MRQGKPKKSLRQTLEENQKALDFWAKSHDKPSITLTPLLGQVKERAPRKPTAEPLEKEIQADIMKMLRSHPSVIFVGRFNRGTMQSSYGEKQSFTQFNTVPGFPDIHGLIRGGKAFYIEVKRPGGVVSNDQREFIEKTQRGGALSGVAYSVDDALKIIGDING